MMKKLLLACVLVAAVVASVSAADSVKAKAAVGGGAPKLVAKTTYDVKWVPDATGKLVEQKTPKKQLFQVVQKKTQMTDPADPSKKVTVEVPTEVPYVPNRKASGKLAALKKRFQALKKRENQLKHQYAVAHSKMVDFPVLEDGAPAPPDRQQIKMAEELYGELEATQFPKAKNIREEDLNRAAQFVKDSEAGREAVWDLFNEMKKKKLVPDHGWGMTM